MSISQEPQQAYGYGRRHLIFINGELINGTRIADFLKPDDFLIGVDGGTNHIVSLGLTPDVVLGDLDSISPETLRIVQDKRIRTLRHPADKDQTDLELAIEFSLRLAPSEIVLVSALGGRVDHMLANIFLLNRSDLDGLLVSFFDGSSRIFLLSGCMEMRIEGVKGGTFSLLPISQNVVVKALGGAQWELSNEDLPLGTSRGVSNLFIDESINIALMSGRLLIVIP
jgi:thiamine pyrophosphokinase